MDHFPVFKALLKPLISIKLLNEIPYDNQGFSGFPERAGFDEKEITNGLFVGDSSLLQRKPHVYASLIQSWFYWGMVHQCLQQPVQIEDFFGPGPDGEQILTTSGLEQELVGWALRLQDSDATRNGEAAIRNARDTLARVVFLLTLLTGRIEKASENLDDPNKQFWLLHGREILPHDLELSIAALGYALDYTAKTLSVELGLGGVRSAAHWYTPPGLIHALEKQGFCKNDIRHFTDTNGFVTACMAVILPGLSRKGDHSRCTADRCEVDNINHDEYEPKHIEKDCDCPELTPPQAWYQMLRIIEEGDIPLVRLRPRSAESNADLDFEIVKANSDHKYVAFSHVWADGRGNVMANGLLRCQWSRLQLFALECQKEISNFGSLSLDEMPPFWIDTFCVPRGSDPHLWELRTKTISMMAEIYRRADVVLVLDSALENAGEMSVLEFGMRLKFCGWSRRAWTLHEGAVAHTLMIKTRMGLIDLRTINYQMARARYPHREEDGWHLLRGIEKEYINVVLQGCLMINKFAPSPKATFFLTWKELQQRATSFETDRFLVLGIINQLDKEKLRELHRTEVDMIDVEAARRAKLMTILLSTTVVPPSIVFSLDERLPDPGMQWAPREIGAEIPEDSSNGPLISIPGKGIIIRYRGWRITNSLEDAIISTFMFVNLDKVGTYRSRYRLGLWPTDKKRKNFATLIPAIGRNKTLAIILSDVPNDEDTSVNFRRALLVEELGTLSAESSQNLESHEIMQTKYLGLLRVYSAAEGENSEGEIEARWVNQGLEQLWCFG